MLKESFVRTAKPQAKAKRYSDKTGCGLLLVVQPTGSKQWIQRIVADGKRRDMGLGSYPAIGLSDARTQAWENKRRAMLGLPLGRTKAPTVGELTDEYVEIHGHTWAKNTARTWRSTLDRIGTTFGSVPVDRLTVDHVLAVMRPLQQSQPAAAKQLRQRLKAILDIAVARRLIDYNPAGDTLSALLPKPCAKPKHHAAMPYADVPAFYTSLPDTSAGNALRFLILTATRTNEIRGMTWEEIDLEALTWTIPAERMKGSKAHTVPLSDAAMQLLQGAAPKQGGLVFPADTGKLLPEHVFRRLVSGYTAHGFRSAFNDWALEQTDVPREVADHALSHMVGNKTEQAYARTTMLEKRANLMQEWSEYLTTG